MSAQDFDLELERRLRDYAAAAGYDATADDVERAIAGATGRRSRGWVDATGARWLLAAALLLMAAAITLFVAGRLQDRRAEPIRDPGAGMTVVAGAMDGGVEIWDPVGHHWTPSSSGSLWRVSPDGRWMVVTEQANAGVSDRAFVLHGTREPAPARRRIWGGVAAADGSTRFPGFTWSPRSDWLLRAYDEVVELAAIDPEVDPIRFARSSDPIDSLAWEQAAGSLGRVAGVTAGGSVEIIDLDARSATSVALPGFAYEADLDVPPAVAWSPDGARLALVGVDGNLWVIDGAASGTLNARVLTSDGGLDRTQLWGWSADGTRIGVGRSTYDPGTGRATAIDAPVETGCGSLPAWGRRGHDIAFVADGRMSIVRSDWSVRTSTAAACEPPETALPRPITWSPDGRLIGVPVSRQGADRVALGTRLLAYDVEADLWTEILEDARTDVNLVVDWRSEP